MQKASLADFLCVGLWYIGYRNIFYSCCFLFLFCFFVVPVVLYVAFSNTKSLVENLAKNLTKHLTKNLAKDLVKTLANNLVNNWSINILFEVCFNSIREYLT